MKIAALKIINKPNTDFKNYTINMSAYTNVMKIIKTLSPLIVLFFINCNYINSKLPLISYERRIIFKVLEGNCSTLYMDGGNRDLAIGKNGVRIRNKDFKFEKNIQALLVKYRFNYGDCISYGSYSFDQITKYPIKIEINPITKDSIEILNVKNKTIRYKMNNEIATIIESDSLLFSTDKLDTTFNKYKGNEQRLIKAVNYKTTIKYMATLNLKTMQYENGAKKSFLNWNFKVKEPKFKRTRRRNITSDSMPVYSTQQRKPVMQQ